MTMDENVAQALEVMAARWPGYATAKQTIRARLVELEAENERLRCDLADADERSQVRSCERTSAIMRAEKADALLRESLSMLNFLLLTELSNSQKKDLRRVVAQITAHLSENGHG